MGYESRPTYNRAVLTAAWCIGEARRILTVHDYAVVLVAEIIAATYEVETRDVMNDLRKAGVEL